jgi:hypothetical protein
MIEPKWLEQTFIVTNRADAPKASVLDEVSLDDESLDIKVSTYRSFVNDHPTLTNYFQPILDRLQVVPSRFDIARSSIVVEGKSDYYILRYAAELLNLGSLPLIPGMGAGSFDALASIHVGWNLDFHFLLDGDKQGIEEKKRYATDYVIPESRLILLNELLSDVTTIEDLLDKEALQYVASEMSLPDEPNKGQIRRFFQERLASGGIKPISKSFSEKSKALLTALHLRMKKNG